VTVRVRGGTARSALVLLLGASLVAGCAEAASPAPSASGSPDAATASAPVATPTTSPASPSATTGYTNPVMVNDAPDPSVIRGDDGAFYAYTTQAYHDVEFTTLPILRSTDLVTWELVGDAFAGDARPSWIVPGSGNGDVWAPHIARVGGRYLLYYSASSASTLSFGIGVAVADSPTGPFRDLGEPLLTGPGFTTIDPFVLDDDGDLYLYWGSAGDPIWVQPLAPDGLSLTGERTAVLETSRQPYESLVEGPWVLKRDGFYHLMYSGDACCGANPSYAVLDARSTSPLGPFERDPGNPVLEANDRFNAPGHHAVVTDDAGTDWMVYHAMDREEGSGLRFLMLDPIDWSSGWPVVNGGAGPATTSSEAPVIETGG
jgi:arabinan endo-1,5-alpha-L-arabinosidase